MTMIGKSTLLAAAFLAMAGCTKHPATAKRPTEMPAVSVKTVSAATSEHKRTQEVAGTVEAKLRAAIEAKTTGRIESMPIRLGQAVQKGELLVQLDARETQARLDQSTATREQAEADLKRLTALLQQQALTQAEFDAAQARFRVADAALRETQTLLGHAKITAPFGGVVVRKLADVGDLAVPGKPLLELEDPSALRFVANVPDALLHSIRTGMELTVQIGGSPITATAAEIAPTGDPVSRTSRVELDLPATGVRSGAFGRLLVPAGDDSVITVPSSAVISRGQLEILFVVRSNRAELRLVKTGKRFEKSVGILSGLAAGEQVVAENAGALRDGQPVTTQ